MACECPIESLKIWPANAVLPTFSLNIHFLQAKPVKRNYPINASITYAANSLKICPICSISHSMEQIKDYGLEERRRYIAKKLKQL